MIEALGASRLKIIFLVEAIYPFYPPSDADENGPYYASQNATGTLT